MKNSLSKMLTAVIAFMVLGTVCLTGCIPVKNTSIDKLQSRDGVMLIISSSYYGPIDWEDEDRVTGTTYNINWDGTISKVAHHLESGDSEERKPLDSSDYMKFYRFAESAYLNNTFKNYSETDVVDGSTYCFTYFPEDRDDGVILYAGYCYSNNKLYDIVKLAFSYFHAPSGNDTGATVKVMGFEDYKASTDIMLGIRTDDFALNHSLFNNKGTMIVYDIDWNGNITSKTLYKDSSEDRGTAKLSDEDFAVLYSFAKENFEKNSFANYHEKMTDDGHAWSFYLFPYLRDDINLYYGPIKENDDLTKIARIAESYFD